MTAMMDRAACGAASQADRALVCAVCGRYLSKRRVAGALAPGLVWAHVKCPGCQRWRWFDVADGRMVAAPGE